MMFLKILLSKNKKLDSFGQALRRGKEVNIFSRLFPSHLNGCQNNVIPDFTKRTKNFVILNSIQNLFNRLRIESGVTINNNVILSRSEGSHNIEILRSLRSLRMTRGKYFQSPPLAGGEVKGRGRSTRKELINLSTYKPIYFQKPAFTLAEGATHVTMPPVFSKAGFTLAEVLITLGIIGVVAAMTIPNLISYYQKHVISTRLKEDYSIFTQVMRRAQDDEVPFDDNITQNLAGNKKWFETGFVPAGYSESNETINNNCSQNNRGANAGYFCMSRIKNNGWEIPNDVWKIKI